MGTQIPTAMKEGDKRTTKQLMSSNFSQSQTPKALVGMTVYILLFL